MAHGATVVFELVLIGAMLLRPGRRARVVLVAAFVGLVTSLLTVSTARHVGDSTEYVAMSVNLARGSPPSLAPDDMAHVRAMFPGDASTRLQNPRLRAPDGRQELPHFWFYSLLAAPFVRIALSIGADPATGFAALNFLILTGLAILLASRMPVPVTLFLAAGPILWWIDKPHTEVLTFSLITAGLVLLPTRPWWSIAAFGAAAAQNPPMAAATAIVFAFAVSRHGWREPRIWIASVAAAIPAAAHPLYYHWRLGIWSGLDDAIDRHWPSPRELVRVMFDPNLGIYVHDPFLFAALVVAAIAMLRRRDHRRLDAFSWAVGLIAVLFLVSVTQTTNVNSGGTPGPSRYGLWLIPFAAPLLWGAPSVMRSIRVLAAASVLWCTWAFAPNLPDEYLKPSWLAANVWRLRPSLDDPLAEVFAERVTGHEPAAPPAATRGCEKVLLAGDGHGALWPPGCPSVPLPYFCEPKGALCYANQTRGVYRFAPAPSTPAWRGDVARQQMEQFAATEGTLVVTQPPAFRPQVSISRGEGWSYPEWLTVPSPDPLSREWRWIGDHAALGIASGEPVVARLRIVARAYNSPKRLRVSIGGHELITLAVTARVAEYVSPEFNLDPGRVSIALDSLDGSEVPATGDTRRLSFQVFRVELITLR
jgi:hypothetical protein